MRLLYVCMSFHIYILLICGYTLPYYGSDGGLWVLGVAQGLLEHPKDNALVDDKVAEGLDCCPVGNLEYNSCF